jgi:phospholipid transport system substrate-binding protein
MIDHYRRWVLGLLAVLTISMSQFSIALANASDDPSHVVEKTVNELLDEFIERRDELEQNNKDLFELVDRVASPLFDFNYISRLVLAKSWKKASEQQRLQFAEEFKNLIIVTYATALFRYTGDETMEFGETGIKERKGVKFGTVNTEVTISGGPPIPVVYSLIKKPDESWKIYNLTVGDLNMVLNYRNVIQSTIHNEGLDGMIASMKENNDKFN